MCTPFMCMRFFLCCDISDWTVQSVPKKKCETHTQHNTPRIWWARIVKNWALDDTRSALSSWMLRFPITAGKFHMLGLSPLHEALACAVAGSRSNSRRRPDHWKSVVHLPNVVGPNHPAIFGCRQGPMHKTNTLLKPGNCGVLQPGRC